jgi:hypothetical protein
MLNGKMLNIIEWIFNEVSVPGAMPEVMVLPTTIGH